MSEHCVQILFPFQGTDLSSVFELEEELTAAIEQRNAGEFDGNEVGGGQVVLYMYGPDADALYEAVAPVLRGSSLVKGGTVLRRYGPPIRIRSLRPDDMWSFKMAPLETSFYSRLHRRSGAYSSSTREHASGATPGRKANEPSSSNLRRSGYRLNRSIDDGWTAP